MLNKLQLETLSDWVKLLKCILKKLETETQSNLIQSTEWQEIEVYFSTKIMSLNFDDLSSSQLNLWQSWQTETHRLIRLLKTDLLFLSSVKQDSTRKQRLVSIEAKLQNAIQLTENLQLSLNYEL